MEAYYNGSHEQVPVDEIFKPSMPVVFVDRIQLNFVRVDILLKRASGCGLSQSVVKWAFESGPWFAAGAV